MSFVFEIEDIDSVDNQIKNLGFVFGSFGLDKTDGNNDLSVFLNGVYLSTGNDSVSALSIIKVIEESLSKKIKAKKQFVASRYGGATNYKPEYSKGISRILIFRAIENEQGELEKNIYSDLGDVANQEYFTDSNVFFKRIKSA